MLVFIQIFTRMFIQVLGFSFSVCHLLNEFDEEAKEHFAAGTNGAVVRSGHFLVTGHLTGHLC